MSGPLGGILADLLGGVGFTDRRFNRRLTISNGGSLVEEIASFGFSWSKMSMRVGALKEGSPFRRIRRNGFFLALSLFGGRTAFAQRPSMPAADSRIFLLSSGHYGVKTWPADSRLALGRCPNITLIDQINSLHGLVILGRNFSVIQHPTHARA
jgi:hypothetical protein